MKVTMDLPQWTVDEARAFLEEQAQREYDMAVQRNQTIPPPEPLTDELLARHLHGLIIGWARNVAIQRIEAEHKAAVQADTKARMKECEAVGEAALVKDVAEQEVK